MWNRPVCIMIQIRICLDTRCRLQHLSMVPHSGMRRVVDLTVGLLDRHCCCWVTLQYNWLNVAVQQFCRCAQLLCGKVHVIVAVV